MLTQFNTVALPIFHTSGHSAFPDSSCSIEAETSHHHHYQDTIPNLHF